MEVETAKELLMWQTIQLLALTISLGANPQATGPASGVPLESIAAAQRLYWESLRTLSLEATDRPLDETPSEAKNELCRLQYIRTSKNQFRVFYEYNKKHNYATILVDSTETDKYAFTVTSFPGYPGFISQIDIGHQQTTRDHYQGTMVGLFWLVGVHGPDCLLRVG